MNATEVIGGWAFVALGLCGMASFVVGMINGFRAMANRKEGVPLFAHWYESPSYIVFRPSRLTDRGLAARRRCFYGFAGFIICGVTAIAIGVLTGATH
jgi:hypothetical protein